MGEGLEGPSGKAPPTLTLLCTVKITLNLQAGFVYKGGKQSWDTERDQILMTSSETLNPAMPRARPAY